MKKDKILKEIKKHKVQIIIFLVLAHFEAKALTLYEIVDHDIVSLSENMDMLWKYPFPDYSLMRYILCLAFTAGLYWCMLNSNPHRGKKFRPGEEYGDARWGTADDIAPFIDKDPYHNMIFSKTERLSMNGRMPDMELNRNKNVLVIGSSGAGKTYGYVKPNILQMDCSYVVTDPNGLVC